MGITQEYNVDCASQKMVIVMGEISICLKGEEGQFSSLSAFSKWKTVDTTTSTILRGYLHACTSI
jgi:hypothetical protein